LDNLLDLERVLLKASYLVIVKVIGLVLTIEESDQELSETA